MKVILTNSPISSILFRLGYIIQHHYRTLRRRKIDGQRDAREFIQIHNIYSLSISICAILNQ